MNDGEVYDVWGNYGLNYLRDLAVKAYITEAYNNVVQLATERLHVSRENYLQGLEIRRDNRFSYSLVLNGKLANMMEDGAGPFDMKEGFAKSTKRVIKPGGGWYLTIPMVFRTTSAKSPSTRPGSKLPRDVYDIIRTTPSRESRKSATIVVSVLSGKDVPARHAPVEKSVILPSGASATYIPKSSIYAGLQRTLNEENGKSTYNTFRRVSDKSDPNSWIHPGFTALRLMDHGVEMIDVDALLDRVLDKYFEDKT